MIASENAATNRISRRTFGKLAALGLIASAGPLPAPSTLDAGIAAYSYNSLPLADMIAHLHALHISENEMSRGEFMVMNHPGDDLFRSARTKLDRAGIRCVSYYCATL